MRHSLSLSRHNLCMRKITKRSQSNKNNNNNNTTVDDDDDEEEVKSRGKNEGSFSASWRMKRKDQLNNNHLS